MSKETATARAIRSFFGNEERAVTVLVGGCVALMLVGLVIAVVAIFFMK